MKIRDASALGGGDGRESAPGQGGQWVEKMEKEKKIGTLNFVPMENLN